MFWIKEKIKARKPGTVVSIREGASRTRVAIEGPSGTLYYFVSRCTIKIGTIAKEGRTVGYK